MDSSCFHGLPLPAEQWGSLVIISRLRAEEQERERMAVKQKRGNVWTLKKIPSVLLAKITRSHSHTRSKVTKVEVRLCRWLTHSAHITAITFTLKQKLEFLAIVANSMNETISARVLVLGGGIAGLSAARRLSAKGVRVTLLEARSRLGGRIDTWHLDGSNNVDLGASFIHGTAGNPIGQYAGRSGFRAADPKDDEMRYVVDRSGGVQLDPETSNRVNFFSFDTTFSRLQRAVQQGNQSPHEEESIWSGLIQNDKYPDVWRGIEQQERNHVLSV